MIKFKKIIASLLSVAVVLSTSATTVRAYSDVDSDAWFAPYVTALSEAWVFDWSKSSFRPSDNMNRAEFVKTLVESASIDTSWADDAWFSDVDSDAWFAPYINTAVANGFIDAPMADKWNKFFPEQPISRSAAVKIALWAFNISAYDYNNPSAKFTDIVGHWGEDLITAAYNLSIVDWMNGSNKMFAPNENISRAAVSKIAAFALIVADDPDTYVRFEDGTSAFSTFTTENIVSQVKNLVVTDSSETTDDEDSTPTVTLSDWTLEISLSSDSPKWAVLPYSVDGVVLAKYDLTSNGDDIKVQSLTIVRKWIWDKDDISSIVVYDDSWRISNDKAFNNDDEASVSFYNWWVTVSAWETITLTIVGSVAAVWSNGVAAWNRSAMSIASVAALVSNAVEVTWDFPITANTFEIWGVAWAWITYQTWSTVSSVKIWEEQKAVENFKLANWSSTEDVMLEWISLKQIGSISEWDEIDWFSLYNSSTKLADGIVNWNYVTFKLDEAFKIRSSKTETFEIRANILWWAADTIQFELNKTLDIQVKGSKYWYAWVTNNYYGSSLTVEAWKISIAKVEPETDKFRKDKKDLVFWKIKVTANAWTDIVWEKVFLEINNSTDWTWTASTVFDNIELYDEKSWAVYGLTCTDADNDSWSASNDYDCTDTDIGISLTNWETRTFAIRLDSNNDTSISWMKYQLQITPIWVDNVSSASTCSNSRNCFKEVINDKYVTDITPSAISYKTLEGQLSSATLTNLTLSSAKDAVVWSADVPVLDFELKADETSALKLNEIILATSNTSTYTWFTRTEISEIKLWKKEWTNETLIATKWWSNIDSSDAMTFNNLDVTIDRDEKVRFVVTVSIIDSDEIENITLNLKISSLDLDDEDDDDVTASPTTITSDRVVTYVWKGTLSTFAEDPSDSELNSRNKNVLADTDTDFIDSFELKSTNEAIDIKKLMIVTYSWAAVTWMSYDYSSIIESFSIYDNDKTTLIRTESVSSSWTLFSSLSNLVSEQTTKNIYVKAKLRKIGKDYTSYETATWFTLAIRVLDAVWQDSWDTIKGWDTSTDISTTNWIAWTWTILSHVVATQITDVDLVSSYNWVSVSTDLDNWTNIIWIMKVTAASTTNTSTWWSALKAVLQQVIINITGSTWSWTETPSFTYVHLEKIWWNWNAASWTIVVSSQETTVTFTWASTQLWNITTDNEIIWESAYYKITAVVSWLYTATDEPSGYLDLDLDDLSSSQITYQSCTTYACTETANNAQTITDMRFKSKTSVDRQQISQVK